jgi:hypothetical protein
MVVAAKVTLANASIPPPNMVLTLLVDVSATTHANDAFWLSKCDAVSATAQFVRLEMGSVVDYFKPVEGATWCEMLTSDVKHQWSSSGLEGSWETSVHLSSDDSRNGGSVVDWPKNNVAGDMRRHVIFWGADAHDGGCCSMSIDEDFSGWNKQFTMSFGILLTPPPPNTALILLADVSASTKTDDDFWLQKCPIIPDDALFVRLVMGAAVDYFKPVEDAGWCEMLTSSKKHMWSAVGVDGSWVTPIYHHLANHRGGSSVDFPAKNVEGDMRRLLSFWGLDATGRGGCCSTSMTVYRTEAAGNGWGIPFTISYGLSTPTATTTISAVSIVDSPKGSQFGIPHIEIAALSVEEQGDLRESIVDIIVANTDVDRGDLDISFAPRDDGNGTVVSITSTGSSGSVEFSNQVDLLVNGGFFDVLEVQGAKINAIVEACSVLGMELVAVNDTFTCAPCGYGHAMAIGETRCQQCGVFDKSIKWSKIGFVGTCAELSAAEDRQTALDIAAKALDITADEASEDDDSCGTGCIVALGSSLISSIVAAVCTWFCRRRRKKAKKAKQRLKESDNVTPNSKPDDESSVMRENKPYDDTSV